MVSLKPCIKKWSNVSNAVDRKVRKGQKIDHCENHWWAWKQQTRDFQKFSTRWSEKHLSENIMMGCSRYRIYLTMKLRRSVKAESVYLVVVVMGCGGRNNWTFLCKTLRPKRLQIKWMLLSINHKGQKKKNQWNCP